MTATAEPTADGRPAADPDQVAKTLWVLAMASLASSMSMRIADPMLPDLAATFGGRSTDMAGVATWFSVAYAALILVQGPLGDRLGKLRVITASCFVAALASVACAAAPSLTVLNALRFVNGAACAGLIPLSLAWIGDSVALGQRQQTLARFAAAATSGLILGQVCGGVITDTLGWRYAFLAPAVMYLIAGSLLWRALPGAAPAPAPGGNAIKQTLTNYRNLFADPWARVIMLTVGLEGAIYFGAIAFIPAFLHDTLSIALWQAGLLVGIIGLGGLLFSLTARTVVTSLGIVRGAALGGVVCAVGLLLIVAGARGTDPAHWMLIGAGCLATGFGFTMLHNTLQTNGTQMRPEARGTAIAGFVMALFGGQAMGIALTANIIPVAGYASSITTLALALAVLGLMFAKRLQQRSRAA